MLKCSETLEILERITGFKPRKSGIKKWIAVCPSHSDRKASLGVIEGDNGGVFFHCFAGCHWQTVKKSIENQHSVTIINPDDIKINRSPDSVQAYYIYKSDTGEPLFRKTRYEGKHWKIETMKGGSWITGLKVEPVVYNLDKVVETDLVFVMEGEKDCDNFFEWSGKVATTNYDGASYSEREKQGKWKPSYAKWFSGKHVVVLRDLDVAGEKHALDVLRKLKPPITKSLTYVDRLPGLTEKQDISDWITYGYSYEDLLRILRREYNNYEQYCRK